MSSQDPTADNAIPIEQTPELVRDFTFRWFDEVWNERRTGAIDFFMADENQSFGMIAKIPGAIHKAEFKELHRQILEAFPDIWFTVDDVIVDGDTSAARYRAEGTHIGEIHGLPATNRKITISGITMIRWRNGKAMDSWNNFDQLGLLRQIGFID